MIRFSKMADYGVLILGHFGRNEGLQASSSELAEAFHMPRTVVANLLKAFREAGFLTSRRGLHGGYRLVRPPKSISLLDILKAIDGPVQLTDCAIEGIEGVSIAQESCDYEDVCGSRSPMQAVNQKILQLLDDTNLEQLMHMNKTETPSHPLPSKH
jgi:Rrf2 family protein